MRVMLVGGFLGAGKTTLLWESAKRLTARGHVVGLITNDQVPDLVDTALLTRSGSQIREVAGSCFCCNFKGFREAIASLIEAGADCIVAEPVGSCTDLSATILQPLKAFFPEYGVAPLTVLIDPERVREVLQNDQPLLHPDACYILHLQLEEADQIVLSKSDTLTPGAHTAILALLHAEFPRADIHTMSAQTGAGVETWLDSILQERPSGTRIPQVDYDRYAHGEAVLGWLNAVVDLTGTAEAAPDWEAFARGLLGALQAELRRTQNAIGHIKILLDADAGRLAANLTGLESAPILRIEGPIHGNAARLTVNARVQISPDGMEHVFRDALQRTANPCVQTTFHAFHCIQPGRPEPTYRFAAVVR